MSGRAFLIVGNDTFRVSQRTGALVESLLPAESRIVGLEVIDGKVDSAAAVQAVSACLQALRTVSLFGGNRVVWLRDTDFIAGKAGGDRLAEDDGGGDAERNEGIRTGLAELAACVKSGIPDGVTFLVTAASVDKRSSLYRAFDAAGSVEVLEISEKAWEAEKQAQKFIADRMNVHGTRMSDEARQTLLERTGSDTMALATEMEKLSLYAGSRPIEAADVVSVAAQSREAIVWELTDAIGARDLAGTYSVLRQLLFQGESPMAIIAVIEGYFRQLAVARDVLDRKWATLGYRDLEWRPLDEAESALLKSLGKLNLQAMNPYRAFKVAQQASRRTARDIKRCRQAALAAHERLVSSSQPQSLTLDFLMHQLLA